MKKLIIVCLLAAIGAVGMIGKSNAQSCSDNPSVCAGGIGAKNVPMGPAPTQNYVGKVWQGKPHPAWQGQHPGWQGQHSNWHGNNGPSFGLNIYTQPNYGRTYYDDPGYYGDDPYYDAPPPPVYRSYSSNRCNSWATRLRGLGFRNVSASDCSGSSYVYRATKAGRAVRVTVSASSGNVIRVANAY